MALQSTSDTGDIQVCKCDILDVLHSRILSKQLFVTGVLALQYMPPQAFVAEVNKFFREQTPPGYKIHIRWDKEPTDLDIGEDRQRKQLQCQSTRALHPKGYDGDEYPVLGTDGACEYCCCSPCVITKPPNF